MYKYSFFKKNAKSARPRARRGSERFSASETPMQSSHPQKQWRRLRSALCAPVFFRHPRTDTAPGGHIRTRTSAPEVCSSVTVRAHGVVREVFSGRAKALTRTMALDEQMRVLRIDYDASLVPAGGAEVVGACAKPLPGEGRMTAEPAGRMFHQKCMRVRGLITGTSCPSPCLPADLDPAVSPPPRAVCPAFLSCEEIQKTPVEPKPPRND